MLGEINAAQIARRGSISPIKSNSSKRFPIAIDRTQTIADNNNAISGLHKLMGNYNPSRELGIVGSTINGVPIRSNILQGSGTQVGMPRIAAYDKAAITKAINRFPDKFNNPTAIVETTHNYNIHTHPTLHGKKTFMVILLYPVLEIYSILMKPSVMYLDI